MITPTPHETFGHNPFLASQSPVEFLGIAILLHHPVASLHYKKILFVITPNRVLSHIPLLFDPCTTSPLHLACIFRRFPVTTHDLIRQFRIVIH